MELTARLIPQMIELHKNGNALPMIAEAYAQKDYDSVWALEMAHKTKSLHKTMISSYMPKEITQRSL